MGVNSEKLEGSREKWGRIVSREKGEGRRERWEDSDKKVERPHKTPPGFPSSTTPY
jgi:hypothetical protein